MDAIKELEYKAKWRFVADFLTDLQEKSYNKGNVKFQLQVSNIFDMWVNNYLESLELLKELRLMNGVHMEYHAKLMDQQNEIEELKQLVKNMQEGM